MLMVYVWVISMIVTGFLAEQKKLGVGGFLVLSIFTGPLAVIIVLLLPARDVQQTYSVRGVNNYEDAIRQLQDLQLSLFALEEKAKNLETLIAKLSGTSGGGTASQEKSEGLVADVILQSGPATSQEHTGSSKESAMAISGDKKTTTVQGPFLEIGPVRTQEQEGAGRGSDMELDFGRNWLNKIGIVVLALGVAFLISYTFKYFGPFLKIAFGYGVGGALFLAGLKLEAKEKFMNYGRVLLGGAWAIIYFTTYAMYHFEASRIIANQGADIFLLALVVAGMMGHVLKYKSEGMMSVVLFVAYLTSTIGQVTFFTVISSLFLALLVLFLVYKFQWVKTLSFGIILTYGIHYIWVVPNLLSSARGGLPFGMAGANYYDLMNFAFLSCYWAVFLFGVHLIRAGKDPDLTRTVAATNFGNIALYSVLSYPLILRLFNAQRFTLVLMAGLIYLVCALLMRKLGRNKMYVSDIVAAVFAITFSISLKFLPTSTLLLWMVEIPFLLFIGTHFKEKIFRYFSYALSAIVAMRILILGFEYQPGIDFLGLFWSWYGFMCFWASISTNVCFNLIRRMKEETENDVFDLAFDQIFSFGACLYLSCWIWSLVRQPWLSFSLSAEGLALLVVSLAMGLRRFRVYAYFVMLVGVVVFLFETIAVASSFLKWFIVGFDVLAVFGLYYAVKLIRQNKLSELFFEYEAELAFTAGVILLVSAIHQYISPQWISLSLGLASVVVILIGFINVDKTERMGGMALLALTLGRVVLVDLSGLDIIFKIITLIVLGVMFLGVSYIYNRFNIGKKDEVV